MQDVLPNRTVLLLGAGHTNAHVLTRWRMDPIVDASLVCVSNFPTATYSGMLPGVLAGLFPAEAMEIDLVRLCKAVDAKLIVDDVQGLDLERQRMHFRQRPPLRYDVLSIGVGSTPDKQILVHGDDRALAIKPMQTFLRRLGDKCQWIVASLPPDSPVKFAIVGGGVAGVEISLCLQQWMTGRFPGRDASITIVDGGPRLVESLSIPAQRATERELRARGIETLLSRRVTSVEAGRVEFDDGDTREFSLVLLATSAEPSALLHELGLPQDERGFLRTDHTLQCVAGGPVFAVGDCGSIDGESLPKAGVYAVRQGPVLWENLRRTLRGDTLKTYEPQRKFLKLLSTGDGRAIASYRGMGLSGRFAWRWKKFIDVRFMKMHQDYSPMQMASTHSSKPPMRCVGCGGKVGGDVLQQVLRQLDVPDHPQVLSGLNAPDDATVLQGSSAQLVATVDFFAPPIDDMFLAGRIAAVNALNDVYAMGAAPTVALASITVPHGSPSAQEQALLDILSGALVELGHAGATLGGGHTLEGPRFTMGFTVLGELAADPLSKGLVRPGDALVLTKPLGTGALLAAHMRADCRADCFNEGLASMLQSGADAVQIARKHGVRAATDITGFGLAGHLLEMLRASGVFAVLDVDSLPLLPGVETLLMQEQESTMAPANRQLTEPDILAAPTVRQVARYRSLFDPQTSGGLLLAAPESVAESMVADLRRSGYEAATIVARVAPDAAEARLRCQ